MGACNVKCSSKLPVYKVLINHCFTIVTNFKKIEKPTKEGKKHRFQILQNHVKTHTKVLIDHIASNREKLVESIIYVKKIINENTNIEFHLVGVFIIIEIVTIMNKFKQKSLRLYNELGPDEGTVRLQDSGSLEHLDGENNLIIRIDENILQFEREFFEMLLYFLEQKYKYKFDDNFPIEEIAKNEELIIKINESIYKSIDYLSEVVFQMNEFAMIINPLFEYFDNKEWAHNNLYMEIFNKIIENSKKNKNLEHFEVVLIDKIIEYLQNENKHFKKSNEIEVRIKVLKLLKKVIGTISYVYLSFLYIDKLISFIIQNIDYKTTNDENLKNIFYKIFKKFLTKIHPFIKNIFQILNSLNNEILKRIVHQNYNINILREIFQLFYFSIEKIDKFPLQTSIPEDLIKNFLKIAEKKDLKIDSYKAINLIFSSKYKVDTMDFPENYNEGFEGGVFNNEENATMIKLDNFLNLNFNVLINILIDFWKQFKEFEKIFSFEKNDRFDDDLFYFLSFYNNLRSIVISIHLRKDALLISGLNSFYMKLSTLILKEVIHFLPILMFVFYDQLHIFSKIWNSDSILKYLNLLKSQIRSIETQAILIFLDSKEEITQFSQNDLDYLIKKIPKIDFNECNSPFNSNILTELFREINYNLEGNEEEPTFENEIPNFDEFLRFNDDSFANFQVKSSALYTVKDFNSIAELNESQEHENQKPKLNKNKSIILSPKTINVPKNDFTISTNSSYENAFQLIKSYNMRRKNLDAILEIDSNRKLNII